MSTEKRSIVQFDLVVDGSSPLGISNLHFDIPLSLSGIFNIGNQFGSSTTMIASRF